ncbi:hypothetical protein Tcan_18635 [Toxocara canis]|uniref:Uncharacterized protein n=1 Tax=Toxocara canis TaxID=6265 RepID=A0A0B2UX61_TOXCA|nr:hypothetical protein Tcan_18635 [Toxocara canis]
MSEKGHPGKSVETTEIEASMSLYEDALDGSDIELNSICTDALRYMKKQQRRKHSRRQKPIYIPQSVMAIPTLRSNSQPLQSSSSEHSSIEQIFCDDKGQFKSKQGTIPRSEKRTHKSASGGSSGSSGEWKLVSVAEANTYSLLLQLNQQLQFISRQLYEMETTNTLQLRLMYRIASESVKQRKRSWLSSLIPPNPIPLIIVLAVWPFVVACIKRLYISYEETCYGVREAAVRIWAGRLAAASGGGCGNGGGRNCGRGSGNIGGVHNSNGRACGPEPHYVIWKRLQRWIACWRSTGDDYRRWKRATRLVRRTETCYGVREAAVRIWAGRLAAASGGGCGNGGGRNCGRGSGNIGGVHNSNGRACGPEPHYVIWKRLQRWIACWRSTGDDYRRWKRATRLVRRTVLL